MNSTNYGNFASMKIKYGLIFFMLLLSSLAQAQDDEDETPLFKNQIGIGLGNVALDLGGSKQKFVESVFFRGASPVILNADAFIRRNALPSFYYTYWMGHKNGFRLEVLSRYNKYNAGVYSLNGLNFSNAVVRNTNVELIPSYLRNLKAISHSKIYAGFGAGVFRYQDIISDSLTSLSGRAVVNGLIYQAVAGYETHFGKHFGATIEAKYMQRMSSKNSSNPTAPAIDTKTIYPIGRLSINYNF